VALPIDNLPRYRGDVDVNHHPETYALKRAIDAVDGVLFVTPEHDPVMPGALRNAIDWSSRPWGGGSFDHVPAAVFGTSPGQVGASVGEQSLRAALTFCDAQQMIAPDSYITYRPGLLTDGGEVSDQVGAALLAEFMGEFRDHIERVLSALARGEDVPA
jgi:chromate reductase